MNRLLTNLKFTYSILTIVIMFFLTSGCSKNFQPPLPSYQYWYKEGTTELDIKKAMLECGEPSTDPKSIHYQLAFGIKTDLEERNASFTASKCMENSGFISKVRTIQEYCSWEVYQLLPICQPGAIIPTPSVERRLNSWYCQRNRQNYFKCQDKALDPYLCQNADGYTSILPECKP